jgi:hypothetical protein
MSPAAAVNAAATISPESPSLLGILALSAVPVKE